MQPRRSFTAFAAQTFGTNVTVAALGLVNVLVVARALGPTGRGSVALLTTIAYLTSQIFTWGTHQAAVNFAAREPRLTPRISTASLLLALASGGAAIATLVVVQAFAPAVLGDTTASLRWLAMASIPFLIFSACALEIVGAHYGFHVTNLAWLAIPVISVTVNTTLALAGALTAGIAIGAWVAGQLVAVVLVTSHLVRRLGGFGPIDLGLVRRMLSFGSKAHVGALLTLTNYRLDQWLMGAILGSRQLGYYSVAVAWAEALFFLPTSLAMVLRPYLARAGGADAGRRAADVLRPALIITAATALALFLLAPVLCIGFFGEAFAPSVDQLRVLAGGAFGIVALKLLGNALTAQGRPLLETLSVCVTSVVVVALDLILIPDHAGLGAAIASAIGYTAGGLAVALVFVRALRVPASILVPRPRDVTGAFAAARSVARRTPLAAPVPAKPQQVGSPTVPDPAGGGSFPDTADDDHLDVEEIRQR